MTQMISANIWRQNNVKYSDHDRFFFNLVWRIVIVTLERGVFYLITVLKTGKYF